MKIGVLLVDDHPIFLKAMKKFLEPACRVIGTASDGLEAIALTEKLRPTIAVLDVYMPRLGGLEACERLLARVPETKVVIVGVGGDISTAEEALQRGACGYVLKVSAPAELLVAIQYVMAGQLYVTPMITSEGVSGLMARAFGLWGGSSRRKELPAPSARRPAQGAARAFPPAEKKPPTPFS